MNWLLIIVLLFLAWNIVYGYSKGFLRVIYSLVAWILILVFVTWATPYVSQALTQHTSIDTTIEEKVQERLQTYVQNAGEDPSSENTSSDGNTDTASQQALEALGLKLPAAIADSLIGTSEVADHMLEQSGLYETVASNLSKLAVKGISYIIVLIVAIILFYWISGVLNLIAKIPIISGINKILGLMAGLVKGLILVWLAFSFIAFGSTTDVGRALIGYIYEAQFLTWLYENNLVLSIILIFL